jgi:uncharacterized membrane protein
VKTKLERSDAVVLALIGGAIALSAAVYRRLPAQVPIHFDLHGEPNGWASRWVAVLLLPLTALGLWALLRPGALLLPSPWQARMRESPTGLVAVLVVGLMVGLHGVILHAALTPASRSTTVLALLMGTFWVALGLVLPRVRRNPWIGVRTPWTLSSDENWAQTHRVAGLSFCAGGVLAVLSAMAGSTAVAMALVVTSAIVPAVYSFFLARRLPPET